MKLSEELEAAGMEGPAERAYRLEAFAEEVVTLDVVYSGQDVVVADLARRAKEALGDA